MIYKLASDSIGSPRRNGVSVNQIFNKDVSLLQAYLGFFYVTDGFIVIFGPSSLKKISVDVASTVTADKQ